MLELTATPTRFRISYLPSKNQKL